MTEVNTETTQTAGNQQVNGQGTASASDQTTTQKQTDQGTQTQTQQTTQQTGQTDTTQQQTTGQTQTTVPASVQERINRMYARLQTEREGRERAERERDAAKLLHRANTGENIEGETTEQPLTTEQVQKIVLQTSQQQEAQRQFIASERRVLERHPTAIKDDGSFNMDDPFTKKYIEIGMKNPLLATMLNGPELAEAAAEKELGIAYRQGRTDEAQHQANSQTNSFTATSTTTSTGTGRKVQLTPEQQRVARGLGLSDEAYAQGQGGGAPKVKVQQKDWSVPMVKK